MVNLLDLKTEIVSDPIGIGYAPHVASGAVSEITKLLNAPRTTGNLTSVPKDVLLRSMVLGDYTGLQASQRQYVDLLVGASGDTVPVTAALTTIFPAGSATRTAVLAAISAQLSRAQVLFEESVSDGDVAEALKL